MLEEDRLIENFQFKAQNETNPNFKEEAESVLRSLLELKDLRSKSEVQSFMNEIFSVLEKYGMHFESDTPIRIIQDDKLVGFVANKIPDYGDDED
jgi:hypothetical protein